jgi:hypothetical protein
VRCKDLVHIPVDFGFEKREDMGSLCQLLEIDRSGLIVWEKQTFRVNSKDVLSIMKEEVQSLECEIVAIHTLACVKIEPISRLYLSLGLFCFRGEKRRGEHGRLSQRLFGRKETHNIMCSDQQFQYIVKILRV